MPRLIWVFAGRTRHFVGFYHGAAHIWCDPSAPGILDTAVWTQLYFFSLASTIFHRDNRLFCPGFAIRVFAIGMKKAWVLSYLFSAQGRLWSDWADAKADLSLRWAHNHFVGFVMRRLTSAFWSMTVHSFCETSRQSTFFPIHVYQNSNVLCLLQLRWWFWMSSWLLLEKPWRFFSNRSSVKCSLS